MPGEDLERNEFHGVATLDFDGVGFIVLSSVLACVALLSNSVPTLIGAMILAPTFDPLIAIPFGVLNKDWRLVRQGAVSSFLLFGISLVTCAMTAWTLMATQAVPALLEQTGPDMITERLTVGFHSILIALAAGAGGALASASNRQSALVGVVVALALVPALAASAIAFWNHLSVWGGLALFAVNVVGILVSGLLVLYLRFGVGKAEEEVERRRRS